MWGDMSDRMRFLVWLCLSLFATGAAPGAERETITYEMDPGWKIGNSQGTKHYSIMEFIPEGDDIQNWKELFTVQNFTGRWGESSPEETMNALKAKREKNCPGTTQWNVIDKNKDSILFEWQAKPCLGWPEQHEIARILYGKYNRWYLRYTAKVYQLPQETRAKWVKILSEAFIRRFKS